jgi:hypothetical protein
MDRARVVRRGGSGAGIGIGLVVNDPFDEVDDEISVEDEDDVPAKANTSVIVRSGFTTTKGLLSLGTPPPQVIKLPLCRRGWAIILDLAKMARSNGLSMTIYESLGC